MVLFSGSGRGAAWPSAAGLLPGRRAPAPAGRGAAWGHAPACP